MTSQTATVKHIKYRIHSATNGSGPYETLDEAVYAAKEWLTTEPNLPISIEKVTTFYEEWEEVMIVGA